MSLRFAEPFGLPLGLLALAAVLFATLAAWRLLVPAAGGRFRAALLLLRIPAVLLLLALLLEPVLTRDRVQREDLTLVVLLDRSRSMAVPDSYGGRPRHRVAAEFLNRPEEGLADRLGGEFRLALYAFDTELRPATPDEAGGDTPPSGILTDLALALEGAAQAVPPSEAVGVVLLTDGAHNGPDDPRTRAASLGLPIYAVGFGRETGAAERRRDLALVSVDAPETAFAENTVVAEAVVRTTGYDLAQVGNRRVRIVLTEGDRQIAAEWVDFPNAGDVATQRVPLRFVPDGQGPHTYRAEIAQRGDEEVPGNNSRTFALKVLERSATVLYFDATMRWESKFLRDFLARDPAVDLVSVLHSGQGRLLVNGDPHGADLSRGLPATMAGLEKFDVVILGDVPAETLGRPGLELLRQWVEEGGGLLTLGGYRAYGPGGYADSPLAEAMPVFLSPEDGQAEEEVRLMMTPQGRVHPALGSLAAYFSGADAPTQRGLTRVRNEKPGAQVLLEAETPSGARLGIALAAQRYGEGRSLAFTGDTTWVWYRSLQLGGPEGLYRRFWGQLLRWLLEEDPEVEQAGEALVFFTDRPGYRIGETVRIRARVRGEDGAPISDATLAASVEGPEGGERLELLPLARAPGHYEARLRAVAPGSYRVSGAATREGGEVGRAEARFEVASDSIEMDDVDLDAALLAGLARSSGGRYYHSPPTAEQLAEDIRGSLVGFVEHEEIGLSDTPLFFLLFVGLLGAEWYLRRRRNLL